MGQRTLNFYHSCCAARHARLIDSQLRRIIMGTISFANAFNRGGDAGALTGLFPDRASAERAYQSIAIRGYSKHDIHVLMSAQTRKRYFSGAASRRTPLGRKAAESIGLSGGIGAVLGALVVALLAFGSSLVMPGGGREMLLLVAAALAGAVTGGAVGGCIGAFFDWSVSEALVKPYEAALAAGGILLVLRPRSEFDARSIWTDWRQYQSNYMNWSSAQP
jgi:hypothetical protein